MLDGVGPNGLPTPSDEGDITPRAPRTPKPGAHAAFTTLEDAGIDLAALPLPYLEVLTHPRVER